MEILNKIKKGIKKAEELAIEFKESYGEAILTIITGNLSDKAIDGLKKGTIFISEKVILDELRKNKNFIEFEELYKSSFSFKDDQIVVSGVFNKNNYEIAIAIENAQISKSNAKVKLALRKIEYDNALSMILKPLVAIIPQVIISGIFKNVAPHTYDNLQKFGELDLKSLKYTVDLQKISELDFLFKPQMKMIKNSSIVDFITVTSARHANGGINLIVKPGEALTIEFIKSIVKK